MWGSKQHDHHRPHQQSTTFDSHDNPSTGYKPLPRNGALISHLSNNAIDICEEYTIQLDISAADLVALKEMSRDTFFLTWKDNHTSKELEGSDEMQRKEPSMSPLHDLCKQYCQDSKKRATVGPRPRFTFSRRRGILSYAAEFGDEMLVSILIELGQFMPDSKDIDGRTPLYWALINGHVEVVKLLLEKGADPAAANLDGRTPLHYTSILRNVEIVKLLLERGIDPVVADSNGETPLYRATKNGHVEVAKLLLEKGADPAVVDSRGWMPLYWASINGNVEIVKLLLEKGIDPAVADSNGRTPLVTARKRRRHG